jgi:hypothetical protein
MGTLTVLVPQFAPAYAKGQVGRVTTARGTERSSPSKGMVFMSNSCTGARRSLLALSALVIMPTSRSVAQPAAGVADTAAKVPFAYGDFTWMNGQSRQKDFPLAFSKYVTASVYMDTYYAYSSNRPADNTVVGSASIGRHNEFMLNLASVGLQMNYRNVIANLSLQTGSMLNIVQDLDGTVGRGRNLTTNNLHNIREATVGYHFDKDYGINVEAGIFMSYIGLESYLLAENWNYSRSLVCDFTPFYFQGIRVQYFPTAKLKIEPWLMNGFQTYGRFNSAPSVGTSISYRPTEALGLITNVYYGTDTPGIPERKRFHSDQSVLLRYFNAPSGAGITKAAFSVNNHYGFQSGGGITADSAFMAGVSVANRVWFNQDKLALTLRGEYITNPTRYLSPPASFSPDGDQQSLRMSGLTATFDIMPTDFMAFRFEAMSRRSNVPFFAGRSGTTTAANGFPSDLPFTAVGAKQQTLFTAAINFRM